MTTDELERLLAQQPVALLHRLARGRVASAVSRRKATLDRVAATTFESQSRRTGIRSAGSVGSATISISVRRTAQPVSSTHHSEEGHSADTGSSVVRTGYFAHRLAGRHRRSRATTVRAGPVADRRIICPKRNRCRHQRSHRKRENLRCYRGRSPRHGRQSHRHLHLPLKALSNTKYTEFSRLFGPDKVGILTGDRQEHSQAPLLIMTTEILRNLLYDAASGEIDVRLDTLGLVILDESQYIADRERGVVWEETIIFCPSQAKLLLLSASIGNPQDIADWLTSIRPTACG